MEEEYGGMEEEDGWMDGGMERTISEMNKIMNEWVGWMEGLLDGRMN